jgi:hypothetical protein
MTNTIKLTRQTVETVEAPNRYVWWLTVEALSTVEGLTSKIFVYHVNDMGDDEFSCVASVNQLDEIPEDQPSLVSPTAIPYYRVDKLTFACRSTADLELFWTTLQHEVSDLIRNFRSKENLAMSEVVYVR